MGGSAALKVRDSLTSFDQMLDKRLQCVVTARYKVHGHVFSDTWREVISCGEGLTAYCLATQGSRPFAGHPATPPD